MASPAKRKIPPDPDVAVSNEAARRAMGGRIPQRQWMASDQSLNGADTSAPEPRNTSSFTTNSTSTSNSTSASASAITSTATSTITTSTSCSSTRPTVVQTTPSVPTPPAIPMARPLPTPPRVIAPAASSKHSAKNRHDPSVKVSSLAREILGCLPGPGTLIGRPMRDTMLEAEYSLHLRRLEKLVFEGHDAPNRNDVYRLNILKEALENHDLALLFMNQLICHMTRDNAVAHDYVGLNQLFGREDLLTDHFRTFCVDFPLNSTLLPSSKDKAANARLSENLAKLTDNFKACAQKIKLKWQPLCNACRNHQLLPLAQDLVMTFGIISPTLQRITFAQILTGAAPHISAENKDELQTKFVTSQDRLIAHRPYEPDVAAGIYQEMHGLMAGTDRSASIKLKLQLMADFLTVRRGWDRVPAADLTRIGLERFQPNSIRPNLHRYGINKPKAAQVFVDDIICGPTNLAEFLPVSEFTFEMNENDLGGLAVKGPDAERRLALNFISGSFDLRLRVCQAMPPSGLTVSKWLARDMAWREDMFLVVNGHTMEQPIKTNGHKILPIDLSEVILPGRNYVKICFNRSSKDKRLVNFAFAIERVTCVPSNDLFALTGRTNYIPAPEALGKITSKLRATLDANDDDLAVVDPTTRIPLVEPFSNSKIFDFPARGRDCEHLQPFDLGIWLNTRPSDGGWNVVEAWKCPICGGDARPNMLVIDGFLAEVRRELENRGKEADCKAIVVDVNGSWKIAEEKTPERNGGNAEVARPDSAPIEVVELDD
ncbi:hypothetical protein K461DRAFT_297730 [Myriangium duriaei CBS 260.36]|uniref:SP-RING-type domain-containing protein n=1 Tax=Myriangium duriaei CBS 260.36 TaxID=1168546 RepID=A0A9P4IV23_9PEZI|nr:hypothetical protein K461DRAFT_297730 [Myriangium duriaei CBS 260.36]